MKKIKNLIPFVFGRNAATCVDAVVMGKSIAVLEIFGNTQICRAISASFLAGDYGNTAFIGNDTCFPNTGWNYSRTEEVLKDGYAHVTIFRRDIFETMDLFFCKSLEDEDVLEGFNGWIDRLPLPMPADKGFRRLLLSNLKSRDYLAFRQSPNGLYTWAEVESSWLFQDDYEVLAEIVEETFFAAKELKVA